jgi:cardiolipin synthase
MAGAAQPPQTLSVEVAGNRLTVLPGGPERLEALISLIDGAKQSLRILYYMFMDDSSGTRVREALIAATGRGVKVSLLVDGFGSTGNREFFRPLIDSDVAFCRFSPNLGRRYLLRNHQKLALADGRRVLVGGFNISDDYFGTIEAGAWRDIGLFVEGDSVRSLAGYFDDLFRWAQGPRRGIRELRRMLAQHSSTEGRLHWLFGGPTRRLSPWARAIRRDMATARRLDIIAAYFAPTPSILRRMGRIARRGTARLVSAAKSDNNATIAAARSLYWYLLKRGVEIYEYQPAKLHTKLVVIDDAVHIGSANFDMRSLFLNLEMMLRIDDREFAAAMRGFVDAEIMVSRRITVEDHQRQRSLLNRIKWALGYFLVAIADYRITRGLNAMPDEAS